MAQEFRSINRRGFLGLVSAGFAFPTIVPAKVFGRGGSPSANEKIQVGVIGLGSRGFDLLRQVMNHQDFSRVVSICDVDSLHYRDLTWGKSKAYGRQPATQFVEKTYGSAKELQVCSDFREVTGRNDIDAVVVATPDHWHALCTLSALKNGKDVYCEKPVTHTFHEGQLVYREVAKQKAIFQTGSQQRSEKEFRRAAELVRNGHLGKITHVEVGLAPGYEKPMGETTIKQPPETLDYDMWCGPAPVLPYMRARHHRWWRGHRAFGGGYMDWIGHHNDIAHWALNLDHSGPVEIKATGWTFPTPEIYNTPFEYEIQCQYADGLTTSIASRYPVGIRFVGESGWLHVTRGKLRASDSRWLADSFDVGANRVYLSTDHMRNFFDCIRSRKPCICPAETAHRSITPGHLGYVSNQLGVALKWNPVEERFVDHDEANRILMENPYRSPWTLV
ncbi:MAG: Inositol 2-dehydrogenase [Planctomycetota bacterium]